MRYARTAWEWDLVGGDPTPGDPCAYEMLSGFFAGTAENAGEASCRLRRLGQGADDTIWRGASADAFREDLDELPKKLDKLYDSYHEASEALRLYGLKLRGLQVDADLELQSAVGADDEVKALVDQTTTDCGGPAMGPAAGAVVAPPAPDPTEEARARLAKARAAVEQIRQDREGAEAQAVERLEHASDLGLQNKGFFDRIAGWVGDRIDDARDLHHKMLRAIGDLADRLADVLTIVAIALVVVAAVAAVAVMVVGTGGTGGALALGLAGSAWSASGTALTAAGWATLASVGAKAESKFLYHDPDLAWSQLVKDGAIAGLGVAGGPVKAVRFIKGSRYLQAAAWKMGELAVSGNRVAQFSIKAAQFAGRGAGRYQQLHDKVLGTAEDPTLAGMVHTGWKESQALWDKHKDDPLAIFTDPVRTSPGPREEPDGAGVWFKDFGRAVAQV